MPDLLHSMPQLPHACNKDRPFARVLTRTAFLKNKPRNRYEQPHTRDECDQHTYSPVVISLAVIDLQPEHDAHDNGQDEDFSDGLNIESDIGKFAAHHGVRKVIFLTGDAPGDIFVGLFLQFHRITR